MRVRLMQIVDYWVGVPLCFIFTLLHRSSAFFLPRRRQPRPKKILFIELSEMGSAILAYSTLCQAKKKYLGSSVYFLIFRRNRESCEILDILPKQNIIGIDESTFLRFALSTVGALIKLRWLGIDTAIDLELFSRCTALITFLSGARNRVGFHRATNEGLYRGRLLTHEVPYNPHMHISLNFLALLSSLESPRDQIPLVKRDLRNELIDLPQLKISADEQREITFILQREKSDFSSKHRLVLLNPDPGEALPIRGWPMDRFIEVSSKLLRDDSNIVFCVIGLARSKPYAKAVMAALGAERCIDLTGKTPTLRSIVALLGLSELLLTNDSGPAHLASLTQIKSITLFGPETPALYGPLSKNNLSLFANYSCSPCLSALNHRYTRCNDNQCLKAISSEMVLSQMRSALGISDPNQSALKVVNN